METDSVPTCETSTQTDILVMTACTQTVDYEDPMETDEVESTADKQLDAIAVSFKEFALTHYQVHINSDFLRLVLQACQHLHKCGRSNVLYSLSKAMGSLRPDGSDSRLPAKRMPMGLLEHMANFYNADSYKMVCEYCYK